MASSSISNSPLVSVIIPAYNAEAFIQATLDSVLAQTYSNIEVLVVNDGSSDRTVEIVERVMQHDPRVKLLQQANAGVAAARNLAIQSAQGDYIAPIDADDIWFPQNLEKQVTCLMQSDESVGLVYSWSLDIDEQGRLTGGFYNSTLEGEVFTRLVGKYFLGNASCSLIRRSCLEKVGGYKPEFKAQNAQGCEDWDLNLRIAQHYQFRVVPEYLVGYRQFGSSMSCNYSAMAKSHELIIKEIYQQDPQFPPDIGRWSRSNFYIYLAVKSSRGRNYRGTLIWLYQALKFDLLATLLRHDLYILFIQSGFNLLTEPILYLNPGKYSDQTNIHCQVHSNKRHFRYVNLYLRTVIHPYLPAQLYEKFRLSKWSEGSKMNETDSVSQS
jgi:glycosyltransferase involved in cell wall biosynthesis